MPKNKTKPGAGTGKKKPATGNEPATNKKSPDVYALQYADGFLKICVEGYEATDKANAQLFTQLEAEKHAANVPGAVIVPWQK